MRHKVTSLSLCPSRIVNPTFTPSFPLPTDYTWGCPPGSLCQPDKHTKNGICDFEVGPPADTYFCPPIQCIPSPPRLAPQYPEESSGRSAVGYVQVSPGYFNLNPMQFGLTWGIFVFPKDAFFINRAFSIYLPGICYNVCNDAMLSAEGTGKIPTLCKTGSEFSTLVRTCQECVNSINATRLSTNTIPQFQQFYFYCNEQRTSAVNTAFSSVSLLSSPRSTAPLSTGHRTTSFRGEHSQSAQHLSSRFSSSLDTTAAIQASVTRKTPTNVPIGTSSSQRASSTSNLSVASTSPAFGYAATMRPRVLCKPIGALLALLLLG